MLTISSLLDLPLSLVEGDRFIILNKFAVSIGSPQSLEHWSVIAHVVLAHYLLNVLSSLLSVVERHIRK